jgi:hypothetical protein
MGMGGIMSEVELHFGTLCVIIRDDTKELIRIKDIAHQTLLALLPEAERMLSKENKANNANVAYDECEEDEASDKPCAKCQETMNHLYV